jgi:hypothetical protein
MIVNMVSFLPVARARNGRLGEARAGFDRGGGGGDRATKTTRRGTKAAPRG